MWPSYWTNWTRTAQKISKIDKENEFNNQWGALLKAREEYYKNASKVLLKDL